MDLGLRGRGVIVAAASEGIGLAAAERFAAEGAKVAICSRDPGKLAVAEERVRAVAARLGAAGLGIGEGADQKNVTKADTNEPAVYAEALDVSDGMAVAGFAGRVEERFGGVDVCVVNAGGPPAKGFLETTDAEWKRAVELNLLSAVGLARAVLPGMRRRRWGRVVTITSVAVRQPVNDLVLSNSVRAGVMGLVKSLSNEFGRDGITVNNVAPGYAATERLKELAARLARIEGVGAEEYLARMGAETAMGRVGEAGEVADAIVWLASERAGYVTGQTLLVDGGLYRGL